MRITLRDVVDGALLAQYPGSSDLEANRAAVSAARALKARQKLPARGTRGLLDAIPGARTLLLLFDPELLDRESLLREVAMGASASPSSSAGEGRRVRVPILYGGADLPELARGLGISPREFAGRHAAARYTVAFLGFSPGFPYLAGLPSELHAPRLATPRTLVPAGSVAIGGEYTGIYPSGTPGGWRLIGRTPLRLFDPSASPPCLLLPGDRVAFEEVSEAEFARLNPRSWEEEESEIPREGDPLFRVLSPGLWTSVQGAPRFGWGSYGVPPGGAMDLDALAAGNLALENPPQAAALEIALAGPDLVALSPGMLSLSGAKISCEINGRPAAAQGIHEVAPGDRVRFGHARDGARAYLCVRGGLEAPDHPSPSRRLLAGDPLWGAERRENEAQAAPSPAFAEATAGRPRPSPEGRGKGPLRVVLGPQDFSEEAITTFLESTYRVSSASDRRGIRLEGPALSHRGSADIPPEGTALGAIQVPAGGLPIVLGPDRPVTGGYAKIATVIGVDWARLAQAVPGSEVRFRAVELAEAVAARREGGIG